MLNEWSLEFAAANDKSLKIASQVEQVLRFNGLASLIPVINTMSLSLKLPQQLKQRNSTLFINQRGLGKSTLLIHILAKSNPKFFQVLDKKIFESQLIEKPKDYFHNKVLIHDDFIVALSGLGKKQKEQLMGIFTLLLSDGEYSRNKNKLTGVKCIAHFGIAKENFERHRKELVSSTFLDRFSMYSIKVSQKQKEEVLEFRNKMLDEDVQLPVIKLPLTKSEKRVELTLTQDQKNRIVKLSLELDAYDIMSFTRAQNYINIFLMSNALLNSRQKTLDEDLQLYELLHQFHLNSAWEISKQQKIIALKRKFPAKNNEELMKLSKIPKSTFYKIVRRLKALGKM